MKWRSASTFASIDVRTAFDEDIHAPLPMSSARMQRRVAVGVVRVNVSALSNQPARQIIRTIVKCERRLFEYAAARIELVGVENLFERGDITARKPGVTVLGQEPLPRFHRALPRKSL